MFVNGNQSIVMSRVFSGLLAGVMVVLTAVDASAQAPAATARYKSVQPNMTVRESRRLKAPVQNALNNAAAFEADGKRTIDSYFQGYYFRQLTQYSPTALANLSKGREELFKKFLRSAKHSGAQQHLTKITLGFFRVVARDNFHPSVRYNATLILGNLSKSYAKGGVNAKPPVPLAEGTKELLELLEQNEFNGVKVHPAVKVAALEGLKRHVRFGLDAQYAARVTKVTMAILAQEPAALGVTEDVNNWIRCQAAQVSVGQFKAAPTAELHAALFKLIADKKMGLDNRCSVVAMLQKMKYTPAANIDPAAVLLSVGTLTQSVVNEGAEKAKEYEEKVFGSDSGSGGGFGRGGFGGGRGGFRSGRGGEEGPKLERRQLLSRLISITNGVQAMDAVLPAEEKAKLAELANLLAEVITVSGSKEDLDLDVMSAVYKAKDSIDVLVNDWKPASAVAAEEDDILGG